MGGGRGLGLGSNLGNGEMRYCELRCLGVWDGDLLVSGVTAFRERSFVKNSVV